MERRERGGEMGGGRGREIEKIETEEGGGKAKRVGWRERGAAAAAAAAAASAAAASAAAASAGAAGASDVPEDHFAPGILRHILPSPPP